MSPDGTVTTLWEFLNGASGSEPSGALAMGTDGNLYGTTIGGDGTIYRLVNEGAPTAVVSQLVPANTLAQLQAQVNPRGSLTNVTIEYGIDGIIFPFSVPLAYGMTGYQTKLLGGQISGLNPGTSYYYRLRAESSAGTTLTAAVRFNTLTVPQVTIAPATEITPTSARFNGTVNARGAATMVVFEWGIDGSVFPNTVAASPSTVSGSSNVSVTAALAGLPTGGAVFYRLRATSTGGTGVSGVASFSALNVATTSPLPGEIGVADAVFRATIDTFGRLASVRFQYWADATPGVVLETAPQKVTSNGLTEVSAVVRNLQQGTSYSYRVSVEFDGTLSQGAPVSFATQPNIPPTANPDVIFYTGSVEFDPVANDTDANSDPLSLDTTLVVPPSVAAAVATVRAQPRSINYNPQNNVTSEDLLVYRITDPHGGSATAQVRLIAFSKRAGFYTGRVDTSSDTTPRNGTVALQFGGTGAITTAFFNWAGVAYRLKGVFDVTGRLSRTLQLENIPGHRLTITLQIGPDAAMIHGSAVERDAGDAIVAAVDEFTLVRDAGTGGLPEAGLRTAFLSPPEELASEMGDGYVLVTVPKKRRSARFIGHLPDGEPFAAGVPAVGRMFPLMGRIEHGGVIAGMVRDLDSSQEGVGMMGDCLWKKPTRSRARYYRGGVEAIVELFGMSYPALAKNALPPIGLTPSAPNARLRFTNGDLPSPIEFPIQLSGNIVSGLDPKQVKLKVQPNLGRFRGSFRHPQTQKLVQFRGAFRIGLQTETGQGCGVFRGPTQAGSVRIEAALP